MNNFLLNLARRGAGLPAGQITARPPVGEYQGSAENLEQDQLVQATEPAALEIGSRTTFETTPAVQSQTSPSPQAQVPEATQVPRTVLTPAPASLIQRSKEANNQSSNTLSVVQSESPAPSMVDQNYASEAGASPPKVVRQSHSPINERPSYSATVQPLTEKVVVAAIPRASAGGQSHVIDSQRSFEPARTILPEANTTLQIVPLVETAEYTPQGESKSEPELEPDQLRVVTLAPRLPAAIEHQQLTKLSNVAPAPLVDVASMPIHVRIGKVEVHAAPPAVPPSAQRVGPSPIGFGSYYRLRTYRS